MPPIARTMAAICAVAVTSLAAPAVSSAAVLNLKSVTKTLDETVAGNVNKALRKDGLKEAVEGIAPQRDAACEAATTENPFTKWGDRADYVPVPNHGFEDGLRGWTTSGRPAIVKDNEPWRVTGRADDSSAARLDNGASVTVDGLCGGLAYPTMRFFSKSASVLPAVGLLSVRYTARDGLLHTLPLGPFIAGRTWQPTSMALTLSGLPLLTGTKLGLQITPISGSIVIDDVYVDPWRRA